MITGFEEIGIADHVEKSVTGKVEDDCFLFVLFLCVQCQFNCPADCVG